MKHAIRAMSQQTKNRIFGIGYVVTALWVLCPPVYLAASHTDTRVLGLPFTVFWMLLDAILILALIWVLWIVEDIRGELEQFESDEEAGQ